MKLDVTYDTTTTATFLLAGYAPPRVVQCVAETTYTNAKLCFSDVGAVVSFSAGFFFQTTNLNGEYKLKKQNMIFSPMVALEWFSV